MSQLDYDALETAHNIIGLIEKFVAIQSERGIAKQVALDYIKTICDNV